MQQAIQHTWTMRANNEARGWILFSRVAHRRGPEIRQAGDESGQERVYILEATRLRLRHLADQPVILQ
jgi:hypothetical protein